MWRSATRLMSTATPVSAARFMLQEADGSRNASICHATWSIAATDGRACSSTHATTDSRSKDNGKGGAACAAAPAVFARLLLPCAVITNRVVEVCVMGLFD